MGDACSNDTDCCGALYCLDGACEVERGPDDHVLPGKPGPIMVTTLPNTGVDNEDDSAAMGALLAGSIASGAAGLWVAIRRVIRATSIP
jgi:LPXTG-motif cell wall-anchored protein